MTARAAKKSKAAAFVRLGPGAKPPEARQVVLVAGAEVPLLALDLPPGLRGPAREQVARRQVQDRIGLDHRSVEMRPFHPPGGADGWNRVLVADAARLAEWRGLPCRAVLPDYLGLPAAAGVWTLQGEGSDAGGEENVTVLARLGLNDGFTAPLPLALAMLARALDEGAPKAVLMLGAALPEAAALFEARGVPVVADPAALGRRNLPVPEVLAHGELAFDLRRDPQAARERLRRRVLPWRWPVLFALVAAGLWSAAQIVATDQTEARTAGLTAAARDLARGYFVPEGPILDIRTQVARALEDARAATAGGGAKAVAPLDVFGRAAEVIAMQPDAAVETASYTPSEGLALVLRLPDFAAADALSAALRDAGLAVDLRESRVSEARAGVRSEMRVAVATADPVAEAGQ